MKQIQKMHDSELEIMMIVLDSGKKIKLLFTDRKEYRL